jgi:hypothetical protein
MNNPESRAAQKESMDAPWRKKGNKGSRRQAAAVPEEEEGNRDRHQRV